MSSRNHRPTPGDDTPANDYLPWALSPGNLIGLAALVVVFLAVLLISQSLPAAIIASLLGYGAGYFLAPDQLRLPQRDTYASGVPTRGATQEQMNARIAELTTTIKTSRRRLPPESWELLDRAMHHLKETADRWESVAEAPEQRLILESIVYDYLPTTIKVFLDLPDAEKPDHAQEWTYQLGTLTEEIRRSRDRVVRHDIEAMRTQGRLLEQRFSDGDLRRFREHGL